MSSSKSKRWIVYLNIYTLGIGLILYLAYTRGLPSFLAVIPRYDLMAHFALYGLWSFLIYQAFSQKLSGPILLSVFTILEEGLQYLSPNRTFSLLDLLFSLLGIALGILLARCMREKTAREEM